MNKKERIVAGVEIMAVIGEHGFNPLEAITLLSDLIGTYADGMPDIYDIELKSKQELDEATIGAIKDLVDALSGNSSDTLE